MLHSLITYLILFVKENNETSILILWFNSNFCYIMVRNKSMLYRLLIVHLLLICISYTLPPFCGENHEALQSWNASWFSLQKGGTTSLICLLYSDLFYCKYKSEKETSFISIKWIIITVLYSNLPCFKFTFYNVLFLFYINWKNAVRMSQTNKSIHAL